MMLFSRYAMCRDGEKIITGPFIPSFTGPGSSVLLYGDAAMGFFGEVASADFISGSALASALGITTGTLLNDTTPWLKFILDGKILFIPKMNIRHNLSWQAMYQAGAVYGDNTDGTYPSGAIRTQNATVAVLGNQFRVKLLSGSTNDNAGNATGTDIPISQGSEWNRLFYPLSTTIVPSTVAPKWDLYTDAQLDTSGNYSWCKDMHSLGITYRVARGGPSVSFLTRYSTTYVYLTFCWRPCLVLQ